MGLFSFILARRTLSGGYPKHLSSSVSLSQLVVFWIDHIEARWEVDSIRREEVGAYYTLQLVEVEDTELVDNHRPAPLDWLASSH